MYPLIVGKAGVIQELYRIWVRVHMYCLEGNFLAVLKIPNRNKTTYVFVGWA